MSFTQKDIDKERAVRECINSGTTTRGVDHSNHYRPVPGADNTGRLTLAKYTKLTMEAFNIQEKDNVAIQEKTKS